MEYRGLLPNEGDGGSLSGNVIRLPKAVDYPLTVVWPAATVFEGRRCFRFEFSELGYSCPYIGVTPATAENLARLRLHMLAFGNKGELVNSYGTQIEGWAKVPSKQIVLMVDVQKNGQVKVWYEMDGLPQGLAFDVQHVDLKEGVMPIIRGSDVVVKVETFESPIPEKCQIKIGPKHFVLSEDSATHVNGYPFKLILNPEERSLSIRAGNSIQALYSPRGRLTGYGTTRRVIWGNAEAAERRMMKFLKGARISRPDPFHVSIQNENGQISFELLREDRTCICEF